MSCFVLGAFFFNSCAFTPVIRVFMTHLAIFGTRYLLYDGSIQKVHQVKEGNSTPNLRYSIVSAVGGGQIKYKI